MVRPIQEQKVFEHAKMMPQMFTAYTKCSQFTTTTQEKGESILFTIYFH